MTFEQRVALMKPLSATEVEVLQGQADGAVGPALTFIAGFSCYRV